MFLVYLGGNDEKMNNIHDRHFRIRSALKNKAFLKLVMISFLMIILLCSCNKDDGNVYDDIEVVNKGGNNSEDITNPNLKEVLTKVKDEFKTLTGLDDVETSELFSFDDTHYIKVERYHDFYGVWRYENGESNGWCNSCIVMIVPELY